jgi:hypothetical protein
MNNIDKVVLPSNGLIDDVPREVTIRDMKGRELSTLFSSLTDASVDSVIVSVVSPKINPEALTDEDKHFILHKTRELTFGDTVEQSLRCPICGSIDNYQVNYSDLDFILLDEDKYKEEVKLSDGTTITRKIPTKASWEKIHRYKEKRNLPDDYSFILLQAAKIETIDGKTKSLGEIITYLENLPAKELRQLYDNLNIKFGLDTTFKVKCTSCKSEFTGGIGINADLFR